jgi:hypothetical protein
MTRSVLPYISERNTRMYSQELQKIVMTIDKKKNGRLSELKLAAALQHILPLLGILS